MGNYKRNSLPLAAEITIFILTDDTFIDLNIYLSVCIIRGLCFKLTYISILPGFLTSFSRGVFLYKAIFLLQISKKYYNMTK